ncbi:MAG: toll/interleukin-1 receptor domain-containing protein [Hyphomonadaceae bacterium]
MADVFISYCRRNLERVTEIVRGFEAGGIGLWWDPRLMPGEPFAARIEQEIDQAKCVVVAWSNEAKNSIWVRAEATEALDSGKLMQVRIDGVQPPLPFNAAPVLDMAHWRGDRTAPPWPQLEENVRGLTDGQIAPLSLSEWRGPALQGFESVAAVGTVSILLTFVVSFAMILAVEGIINPQLFYFIALGCFGAACIAAGIVIARLVQTLSASRKS